MSPFVNNTLDPDIWDNSTIRPHIRASLLRIAAEFLIGLNIEVSPKDITLTGSMANFNYNPQSDLDLHVVIGFSDVDNDVELVKQFLMAKKSLWNLKHQITVKGHDVEVYPQDNSEPHHSTGVYSLLNNEWLVKPTRDDPNIDPATVEKKFNSLAAMIDGILGMPDRINHIANVREKLGAMRKLGLSKAGEFSVENLAFKKLRREGYLDRLASAQLQDRDASLSIAEEGYKMKITKGQLRRVIKEELSFSINSDVPRGYLPLRGHQRLFERSYVTGVLGVHMPLNESYPYSHRLYEEILREQFLFEGFWGELLQKGKDKLLDAKEGIKKFGKETWAVLAAFYEVAKGGDGEISSFTKSIAKKGINKLFNKIRGTLKWMVAKLPEWDMPTFSDWAQKGLDALDAIQENVNGLGGWKRVIGFAGLAVGLHWLWDKVGGWIDELKEKVGDFGQALADDVIGPIKTWIKDTAMEKLKEVGGDAFKKIMTTLASISSGVKPWWDAAVKVAGGAKLVIDALGPAADRYISRLQHALQPSGTNEIIDRGNKMKITTKQLNKIIREELRTKPKKHGSLKIIKEEKQKLLKDDLLQDATDRLVAVLDDYITVLDESMGYNISPGEHKAKVHSFVDTYFANREEPPGGWETGTHHEDQRGDGTDGTPLAEMSSSWQQVLGSTRGYPK